MQMKFEPQARTEIRGGRGDEDLCCLLRPELFQALAEPNRLTLLLRLASMGRPASVSELKPCCARDFSVISRHLSRLRKEGILSAEKRGKEVYYRLTGGLAQTLRQIADALDACCPPDDDQEEDHEQERRA